VVFLALSLCLWIEIILDFWKQDSTGTERINKEFFVALYSDVLNTLHFMTAVHKTPIQPVTQQPTLGITNLDLPVAY
jgi:hypothetical protein